MVLFLYRSFDSEQYQPEILRNGHRLTKTFFLDFGLEKRENIDHK